MVVCDDILTDPHRPGEPMLVGLICLITPGTEPAYPFWLDQMCVFMILTEGRGTGSCQLKLVFEETGQTVWETQAQQIAFGADPLALHGIIFRDRHVPFPAQGVYSVQFWYNDQLLAQQTVRAR
jgi:hypothetical protein